MMTSLTDVEDAGTERASAGNRAWNSCRSRTVASELHDIYTLSQPHGTLQATTQQSDS